MSFRPRNRTTDTLMTEPKTSTKGARLGLTTKMRWVRKMGKEMAMTILAQLKNTQCYRTSH
ncbi:hypothetical protein IEO21_05400 [Rhodonia placenta]|uniref:Uncharacterized protein n=1 Tax=Rhodonia placenta TaxID=104341 RepID=A0A8H7P2F2_9APHY|nr:hypothetical protein IEO21_05400 [Postia placenta]